jgi:hypothetical protein
MNTRILALASALCLGLLSASAAEKKMVGGPKGGRLLENTEPRAEFFVEKDHTVTVTFYDANLKPIPATNQAVNVVADAKGGKTKLDFEKKGAVLVSKGPLPEGDGYNVQASTRCEAAELPDQIRRENLQRM